MHFNHDACCLRGAIGSKIQPLMSKWSENIWQVYLQKKKPLLRLPKTKTSKGGKKTKIVCHYNRHIVKLRQREKYIFFSHFQVRFLKELNHNEITIQK